MDNTLKDHEKLKRNKEVLERQKKEVELKERELTLKEKNAESYERVSEIPKQKEIEELLTEQKKLKYSLGKTTNPNQIQLIETKLSEIDAKLEKLGYIQNSI
jgi:hypothetical protein